MRFAQTQSSRMDTHRSRRRFVVVAVVIWTVMVAFLFFLVPPQPRLTLSEPRPFVVAGITADNQTLVTVSAPETENGEDASARAAPIVNRWDLASGKSETMQLDSNDKRENVGLVQLASGGQTLTYRTYRGTSWQKS